MPALKQTPDTEHPAAEDIDEPAARRSIRVLLIVLGALYGSVALAGILMLTLINDGPPGDGVPAWAFVLIVALLVVPLAGSLWWARRLYRKPVYRRVMQYGWRRRRLVTKDLLRGRPLSAEDMPVAAAMVEVQRSQGRWFVSVFFVMPLICVYNGFVADGFLRWFQFSLAAYWMVALPFILRQRGRVIRNYERQTLSTVVAQPGDRTP
jgi:hypothetical protein